MNVYIVRTSLLRGLLTIQVRDLDMKLGTVPKQRATNQFSSVRFRINFFFFNQHKLKFQLIEIENTFSGRVSGSLEPR